jgi:ketosteroid isomerase-like protein
MAAKSLSRLLLVAVSLSLPVLAGAAGFGAAGFGPAARSGPVPRGQRHEYQHEIEHIEEAWRSAMLAHDAGALDHLLAEDYTGITAEGAIQTKDQAVANLRTGGLKITGLSVADRKVRVYGATAVVTSLAELKGSRDGREMTGRYRYTRVLVRNLQGDWKIVSFEASKIQEQSERK